MHRYLFADEAGCFTFNHGPNISKYFILCTITVADRNPLYTDICDLRRELIHDKEPVLDYFHATEDKQQVRDAFYETILKHNFQVQATICEKSKAMPRVRRDKATFYKYPWFYHFKHGIAKYVPDNAQLTVTAASVGARKERMAFSAALDDVMQQTVPKASWAIDFRPCIADPCLQVADYCAWAIQRKWEKNDIRSYEAIAPRISYEYELWKHGSTHYY